MHFDVMMQGRILKPVNEMFDVVERRARPAIGNGSRAIPHNGEVASAVGKLKSENGKTIQVPGSPRRVRLLLHEGLLDELSLTIISPRTACMACLPLYGEDVLGRVGRDIAQATGASDPEFGVLSRLSAIGKGKMRQQALARVMTWTKAAFLTS